MTNRLKKICLRVILPLAFWLFVWQISALIIGNSFLLPTVEKTLSALLALLGRGEFYTSVLLSLFRVISGLIIGIIAGIITALLCHKSETISSLLLPIIKIIKSTPVASFIVLLWVIMSGDGLAIFIGFLMVMPIIYQSAYDGIAAIDIELSEVATVFNFSAKKRFRLLTLPTLKQYLAPAIITATGLCWKAVVAAEIIAYTKRSVGQGINDARYEMDTPSVFAWTVVIIIFSLTLEWGVKRLIRRWKNVL